MSAYSWLEHITIAATIPLALIGFGFTLIQVARTKKSADAARNAATSTQRDIGRSTLLLLIPQLQRIEEELERAVGNGYMDVALSWLATWRWQASQLRALIGASSRTDRETSKAIQASIVAASDAKTALIGAKDADLIAETLEVRNAIATVTNVLGELAVSYGIQVKEPGNE